MKPGKRLLMGSLAAAALLLGLVAPLGQASLAAGAIIYVDSDATGAEDGTSWEDAFSDLQAALDIAASGDQIWVAAGIYKPTVEHGGTGDRYQSFQMKNGVAIYGGFNPSGGDTAWEDRNWDVNLTTLSGDLIGDDELNFTNNAENSYHVFFHPAELALDSSAILDGFTITGGNANAGMLPHYYGAGMYNAGGSPALTNVVFTSHNALGMGGGMYNIAGSSPLLTAVSFSSSQAQAGGGMYNEGSNPVMVRVSFADNSADNMGGGMFNLNSSPTLTDAAFTSNRAMYGGGMYNYYSNPPLTGVTFSANDATLGGGMYNDTSQPTLMNVNFSENLAADGGGMLNKYFSDPVLTNVTFYGNQADNGGGMFNSQESNPTVVNSVFSRNWAGFSGGGMYNEYGSGPRMTNVTFAGNDAGMAGGMYNYDGDPILNNTIFWDSTTLEIFNNSNSKLLISYSDIKGGCPTYAICDHVINLDPQFIRIPSPVWGSGEIDNGDLRLQLTSPAIDAGINVAVPAGITDLLGLPRFVDILSVLDTGFGTPPIVDMGAYEAQVVVYLAIVTK